MRFTLRLVWRAGDGTPILDEVRTAEFSAVGDEESGATVCDITSAKTAAYGALEYPATKFGSACVRVDPRLLPLTAGEVLADGGRRGSADQVAMQQACTWVAYEGRAGASGHFGVLLSVPGQRTADWFVRDYGMAVYNPTLKQSVHSATGDTWTVHLRVAAYDHALTDDRAQQWVT